MNWNHFNYYSRFPAALVGHHWMKRGVSMGRPLLLLALLAPVSLSAGSRTHMATIEPTGSRASAPQINTADVDLFYRVYDATGGHPTVDQMQRNYLDVGSDGLRTFTRVRGTTASRIVQEMEAKPSLYDSARRCAAALPRARPRLQRALSKLRTIYPAAKLPPITIVIGRGRPVGVGSPIDGLQIGLEALCGVRYYAPDPADRFVFIVAHEYIHVQQRHELVDNDTNWTVLEGSLVEGAADFVGELISGGLGNPQLARDAAGHEREIEERFVRDEDKTDLSGWLNDGTMEHSGNLGYWVGYRIVRAYYRNAHDKRQAIRDVIEMTDPKKFLVRSGWRPGYLADRADN